MVLDFSRGIQTINSTMKGFTTIENVFTNGSLPFHLLLTLAGIPSDGLADAMQT